MPLFNTPVFLSLFQISFQIPVIILMGADHYQVQSVPIKMIRQETLKRLYLEFVYKNPLQIAPLLDPDRRGIDYQSDLIIEDRFLNFAESLDSLRKGS
ncbi:hypothetical protein ES708_02985 [subsurface metagenome]